MASLLRRLISRPPRTELQPGERTRATPAPAVSAGVTRRVLMIVHDPVVRPQDGQTLHQHFRWNDPARLAEQYCRDVRECSHGYANFVVAERLDAPGLPRKADGFAYSVDSYLGAWQTGGFHQPDAVDYHALLAEFGVIEKVSRGAIDEVWLFGPPYAGYYESIMAGPGAFWCNAPPLTGTERSARRFVIMGFNYERGAGEMLEDLGHRAESILGRVFERTSGETNLFERFCRYDARYPRRAECGNVHFAPNSVRDYDWGNPQPVPSRCDTWLDFPDLSGPTRMVNCADWGNGDTRAHHLWWLARFPHVQGSNDGISWNWWEYVVDPDRVK